MCVCFLNKKEDRLDKIKLEKRVLEFEGQIMMEEMCF